MIKRTFTYETLDGEEFSEEYLFNLTKTELRELYYEREGGAYAYAQSLASSSDAGRALQLMIELVMYSVGKRSENGRYIEKNEEIRKNFRNSPAYDELMTDLLDEDNYITFLSSVVPKENGEQLRAAMVEAAKKAQADVEKKKPSKKTSKKGESDVIVMTPNA